MAQITKSEGSLFVQLNPKTSFRLLTCSAVGDITFPQGDVTTKYAPSAEVGKWKPVRIIQGEPGAITGSIERLLRSAADVLLHPSCPFAAIALNFSCAGMRGDWSNFNLRLYLLQPRFTSKRLSAPITLEPNTDLITHSVEFSALDGFWYSLPVTSVYGSNFSSVTDIAVRASQCSSDCAPPVSPAEIAAVVDGTDTVQYTTNRGLSWESATAPDSVRSAVFIQDTFVAGSASATGLPARIFITNDWSSWTTVSLPTANGVAVNSVVVDYNTGDLYVATGSGMFRSLTGGKTFVSTGVTSAVNDVAFRDEYGYVVGQNAAYRKVGTSWVPMTITANLVSVTINTHGHGIAVGNDGSTFRLSDRGVEQIGSVSGVPYRIRMDDTGYIGFITTDAGRYITDDGGVTWNRYDTTASTALASYGNVAWLVAAGTVIQDVAMPSEL